MADLVRTGLSLERELLDKFDEAIARRGYQNRSEAIAISYENTSYRKTGNKTR